MRHYLLSIMLKQTTEGNCCGGMLILQDLRVRMNEIQEFIYMLSWLLWLHGVCDTVHSLYQQFIASFRLTCVALMKKIIFNSASTVSSEDVQGCPHYVVTLTWLLLNVLNQVHNMTTCENKHLILPFILVVFGWENKCIRREHMILTTAVSQHAVLTIRGFFPPLDFLVSNN